MGMSKDLRDLSKTRKQMKKERGGSLKMMKDGLAQANQTVQQVQSDQALAEKLANEGVDGTATINGMQAHRQEHQHAARASVRPDRGRRRQPVAGDPHSERGEAGDGLPRSMRDGANRIRTGDLSDANRTLYQLSYGPVPRSLSAR
jgi:hypothetical protein